MSKTITISETEFRTLRALARRTLWVAYCWNDHNFGPAHKYARKAAGQAGINDFDQANAWLESLPVIQPPPIGGPDDPSS